jgi:hypothetical protein
MATRKPATGLIQGHATHHRTESDYMATILDTVTLDDWKDVVEGALVAAKGGGRTGARQAVAAGTGSDATLAQCCKGSHHEPNTATPQQRSRNTGNTMATCNERAMHLSSGKSYHLNTAQTQWLLAMREQCTHG